MDKQIEEMAEIMYQVEAFELETLAEALFNAGYCKIPEGAVVYTKERVDKIFNDYAEYIKKVRKETAEKFAERLKESETIKEIAENGYIVSYVELCNKIDEICKELEGEDGTNKR